MNKKNTILDVLLHISRHYAKTDAWLDKSPTLVNSLQEKGFNIDLINDSLDWLINLFNNRITLEQSPDCPAATRIFSTEEYQYFRLSGINFILFLEAQGVLNALTRELVIQQSMLLGLKKITIPLIKGIVAFILLMDETSSGERLRKLNFLLLQDNISSACH
jgi:Smg protein